MINKDLRSTKQQLENTDTVTTNRKELQQLAQLHILGIAGLHYFELPYSSHDNYKAKNLNSVCEYISSSCQCAL